MVTDKKAIVSDINNIFKDNDIPWIIDMFSEDEYAFDGNGSNRTGMIGTVCSHPVRISGCAGNINGYPSTHYGPLSNEYIGICDNEKFDGVIEDFIGWCKAHMNVGTTGTLTAVIITDRWEPSVIKKNALVLYEAGKSLDIRGVFIHVTCQGATLVKFNLRHIVIDSYDKFTLTAIGYDGIRVIIQNKRLSPYEVRLLQDPEYCRLVFNLDKPLMITAADLWHYNHNDYNETPIPCAGEDYYIFDNWKDSKYRMCKPKLFAWMVRYYYKFSRDKVTDGSVL